MEPVSPRPVTSDVHDAEYQYQGTRNSTDQFDFSMISDFTISAPNGSVMPTGLMKMASWSFLVSR